VMMIRVAENLIFDPDQLKPDAIDTELSIHVLYVTSQYSLRTLYFHNGGKTRGGSQVAIIQVMSHRMLDGAVLLNVEIIESRLSPSIISRKVPIGAARIENGALLPRLL
jgi:hypothetical protein